MFNTEYHRLQVRLGETRSTKKFTYKPVRCPASGKWYYFRRILTTETAFIRTVYIGSTCWPVLDWRVKEIAPA